MTIATLAYHAHDGCPTSVGFVEKVRARTSNVEFDDRHGKANVQIVVRIERSETESKGRLTIVSIDAGRTEREITSATCSELVRALALSAAMSLDPSLAEAEEPAPSTRSVAPIVPPAAADVPAPVAVPKPSVADPERPAATSLGLGVGSDRFFDRGAASVTLFVDHVFAGRTQPSWRAALHAARMGLTDPIEGSANLYWITARLTGSPIRFRLGPVDVVPSAIVEAGLFAGAGDPKMRPLPRKDAIGWAAVGLGPRIEVPLAARWVVELDAYALAPLTHPEVAFGPTDPSIFETPWVTVSASLEARYVLP